MTTNTAAELLIRIAADPSQVESKISAFRANFSQQLTQLGASMADWAKRGGGDFARVETASLSMVRGLDSGLSRLNVSFDRNRQSTGRWKTDSLSHFSEVMGQAQLLHTTLFGGLARFDQALVTNLGNTRLWSKTVGEAFTRSAEASVRAVAQEAIIRAIFETAMGFAALARLDFRGAALHFKSAATFGAVGGAALVAERALAGGHHSRQASASQSRASTEHSTASAPHSAAQQTVQIIFQGPIYGGQAGIDQLTREISQAVQERDVNLVAHTVVRQPAPRA